MRVLFAGLAAAVTGTAAAGALCDSPPPAAVALPYSDAKVVHASVFHRHGDRVPVGLVDWLNPHYKWDCTGEKALVGVGKAGGGASFPVQAMSDVALLNGGSCLLGQLSAKGAGQGHAVGAALRKAYVDFHGLLPATVDPSEYLFFSSPTPRALRTGAAAAVGLYPELGRGGAAEGTVPVRTQDPNGPGPWVFHGPMKCPTYGKLLAKAFASPEFQQVNETELAPALYELADSLGVARSAVWGRNGLGFQKITDVTGCAKCAGLPPPPNVTAATIERVWSASLNAFGFLFAPSDIVKIDAAPLLSVARKYIEAAATGAKAPKLVHWSGHCETLVGLMLGMNMTGAGGVHATGYASTVIFEVLQRTSGEYLIRVLVNGKVAQLPCSSPDHEMLCTYDGWMETLKTAVAPDWKEACFGS